MLEFRAQIRLLSAKTGCLDRYRYIGVIAASERPQP
jgi:hypothetical protein